MKTIVVTGGAGFIGSELVRQVAASGARVVVVDNLMNGKRENVAEVLDERVRLEVEDIRNGARMKRLLSDADAVFHLACLGVRHSIHSPVENHEVNAGATLGLLEAAREANVGRFVYVSSSEVYGTAKWTPMTEDHPTYPHTVYGASKLAGECYARAYHDTYGFPTVIVRPFNTYGPRCHHEGDSGEVIPKFLLRTMAGLPMVIFGDGAQTRDFTYVRDTARGILMTGLDDRCVGQTVNIGQGSELTINDLAKEVAAVLGRRDADVRYDDPRPGDVRRLYADTTKARTITGFKPEVTLREGLSMLKRWYEESGKPIHDLLKEEKVHNWEAESR